MAKRKRSLIDEVGRTSKSVVGVGVGIGVGGATLAGLSAAAPGSPSATGALATTAGFLPVATTATLGLVTVRGLRGIQRVGKKKRRTRR